MDQSEEVVTLTGVTSAAEYTEARENFISRTVDHIKLVNKYFNHLVSKYPYFANFNKNHDKSKFGEHEFEPYIWITLRYKLQGEGVKAEFSKKLQEEVRKATFHHIINNEHHPEYWHYRKWGSLPDQGSNDLVDATDMEFHHLAEMVADWCAMAEELGGNPAGWANSNIGVRWRFTDGQIKEIYDLIYLAWLKEDWLGPPVSWVPEDFNPNKCKTIKEIAEELEKILLTPYGQKRMKESEEKMPSDPKKFDIEWYHHHSPDLPVAVQSHLKGRHREHCLCFGCARFTPEDRDSNCNVANDLYALCVNNELAAPVWECPYFIDPHKMA